MPIVRLTDASVRSLKTTGKRVTYLDESLTGFGVRVAPSGTKTYTVTYGANRKRKTIGRVGIVSLSDARREARKLLAEHTLGRLEPHALSYEKALSEFLEESGRNNKPRTTADYKRLLNLHFKYGRLPLGEITKQDIKQRLGRLTDTPSERRHAFVAIRRFVRWAVANQYLEHNPVDGISVPVPKARDKVLPVNVLRGALELGLTQKTMFHSIVALLILTGQRRSEIGSLQWEWMDGDVVTLPDTKGNRVHRFPLGAMALEVLDRVPRKSPYVFPARTSTGTSFNGWGKAKAEFDKELGFSDYTLHDLRRTFATILAELGTPIHVTEKLLNHVSGTYSGVVGVYQRYSYMDEMREALRMYEVYLSSHPLNGSHLATNGQSFD